MCRNTIIVNLWQLRSYVYMYIYVLVIVCICSSGPLYIPRNNVHNVRTVLVYSTPVDVSLCSMLSISPSRHCSISLPLSVSVSGGAELYRLCFCSSFTVVGLSAAVAIADCVFGCVSVVGFDEEIAAVDMTGRAPALSDRASVPTVQVVLGGGSCNGCFCRTGTGTNISGLLVDEEVGVEVAILSFSEKPHPLRKGKNGTQGGGTSPLVIGIDNGAESGPEYEVGG